VNDHYDSTDARLFSTTGARDPRGRARASRVHFGRGGGESSREKGRRGETAPLVEIVNLVLEMHDRTCTTRSLHDLHDRTRISQLHLSTAESRAQRKTAEAKSRRS
jgi:hypothetical protein